MTQQTLPVVPRQSSISSVLATILGTLRDGGRDIQRAVGGTPVDLVKPVTAKLFPPIMMMGLMVLIGALVVGIVVTVDQSNYWLHARARSPVVPRRRGWRRISRRFSRSARGSSRWTSMAWR